MDNQMLRAKFRAQLTNVHALTVITVSLFEIIGYIVLVVNGVESFSLDNSYLWYGVIFPGFANTITHLVARIIVNSPNVTHQKKNETIIIAALVTSFIVAVIHKEYLVTSCAFIFPLILSSLFNDKKLLIVSFISSIFILFSVGVALFLDDAITLKNSISLFILFGFSLISFLCGIISINFSDQNSDTIELQAEQNDMLRQVILRDQMTGLYNHNSFETQLEKQIKDYTGESSLYLAMLDVDDFKQINDTYGHDCGDDVLIRFAKTLKIYCEENDTAYRYGGEEFAIVFNGKSLNEAKAILEKILEDFSSYKFEFTNKPLTFSAGLAVYTKELTQDDFFEKADKTLYKAKREGKNRVLIAK